MRPCSILMRSSGDRPMSPLDKKLLRDLWRIKGQALAIGAVIGVGVLMLVMMTGLVTSLDETRRAYYERHRLADVFVPLVRAPERMEARLAEIPGVASAEGRISGSAQIDLSGEDLPLQARIISLPENGEPQLNEIYLTDGRRLDEANPDEIILLKSFADARGLLPGDALTLTIRGGQREFQIVGLARSPEFLYVTAPGEIAPDDARYAVIWMGQATAAAAFDMSGAFNEALVSLTRDAREPAVIESIDQLVRPYGGLGAYGLEDHFSDRYVSEEISGLRGTSAVVPPVFLAVAAFLLYIVISRMVQAERSQIGLIKAFGYTDLEVGAHYFKLILVIAVSGALLGCLGGIASGRSLVNVYVDYFKFPFLLFEVKPSSFILGILVSVLSASAGGAAGVAAGFCAHARSGHAPGCSCRLQRIGAHRPVDLWSARSAQQNGSAAYNTPTWQNGWRGLGGCSRHGAGNGHDRRNGRV